MKLPAIKPIPALVIGAFVLGSAALIVTSPDTNAAAEKKAEGPKPALTVTTAKPSAARLPIRLTSNGNVAAWQEAVIGTESGGLRLTEVRVNVGDSVKEGEVLAVFDSATIAADVAQAEAALAEAQANAGEAQANAKRARTLQTSGALSEQQISQYLTAERTANARIASSRAALASQKLRLKYTRVLAPDGGVISARSATVGSVVGVGTELFRMIRQGRLEWRAEVTASELARIKRGMGVLVKAANGQEVTGKVRMIAPTIDAQTRSALVYVDLPVAPAASAGFKQGMFASGQFELGTSEAMTVPQQAIAVRDGFSYVFRVNPDGRVNQLKIQPGRRLSDRIEVLGGLTPETQIVVSGAGFLNDGDLVRAVPATAAKAPAKVASAAK